MKGYINYDILAFKECLSDRLAYLNSTVYLSATLATNQKNKFAEMSPCVRIQIPWTLQHSKSS
jgi:hypothetical protein